MGWTGAIIGDYCIKQRSFILGLVHSWDSHRPPTGGTTVLATWEVSLMKTLLRLLGKITRWYITLILFMACLLFIITTLGDMAGF